MANVSSSRSVVLAAIAADVLIAAAKFAAAALTGGASIAAEGIHSTVDALSGGLMLYGYRQSAKGPDSQHPLGHGRELYFWSFIVSLLLFTLGAGLSVAQGVTRILNPQAIHLPLIIFAVLFVELVFAGFSWRIAFKTFRTAKGELGYWEAIKSSKDPPGFIVLAQDTSSLIGVLIAATGTFVASFLHAPIGDGIASVLIGVLLASSA